jgi:hypothetical protein
MHPDDRVLIGVITRVRDWAIARQHGWYRVPVEGMPRAAGGLDGLAVDYVALFLGRTAARAFGRSGVYAYAAQRGVELARRRDLLPDEAEHPRADALYYRIALDTLMPRTPPLLNPHGRRFAFILTSGERFVAAACIADLQHSRPYQVARLYRAARPADRFASPL